MELTIEMYGYSFKVVDINYENVKGSFNRTAASDMDYYGWEELDYKVESITDTEKGVELKGIDFDEVKAELDAELATTIKTKLSEPNDDF